MRRSDVLRAAGDAVAERERTHGDPEEVFRRIAGLWSVILDRCVEPYEVALCMSALKIARLMEAPGNTDSWVDIAGYAACGAEVAELTAYHLKVTP